MPLIPGTRLGPYEIVAPLGAGGMGEVYRARDTKLGRDVAVKLLPDEVAADTERMARFAREAHLLAALNHPHIAAIYGLEDSGPRHALVMELVDGPTLQERLARGALPLDEALPLARQIAEALEAAHERGIIHRDLKPANIKVTPEGQVKVLDFGLAKAFGPREASPGQSPAGGVAAGAALLEQSPTLTTPARFGGTLGGVILGTAAYMSPEQARGRPVDKRTDIWAFGCVLFECLAGKQAFAGESVTDVLAAIVRTEPDWTALPAEAGPRLRELLDRCLRKDPTRRLRDIGDARLEIDAASTHPAEVPPPSQLAVRRASRMPWLLAVVMTLVAAALAVRVDTSSHDSQPKARRFAIPLPEPLDLSGYPSFAVSRDGMKLVYRASGRLFVRRLDESAFRPVRGSEGGQSPFFSPDGHSIGFFADGQLKRVPFEGGPTTTVASGLPLAGGGSWGDDDQILFQTQWGGAVASVPASGGGLQVLLKPDPEHGERGLLWPQRLGPAGAVLFTLFESDVVSMNDAKIAVGRPGDPQGKLALTGGTFGRYLPTGHLVYGYDGKLMAASFDLQRLTLGGAAVPVLDGVLMDPLTGSSEFAVSDTGDLFYVPGAVKSGNGQLALIDRAGRVDVVAAGTGPEAAFMTSPRFSPDGTRLAVCVHKANDDIHVYNLVSKTMARATFEGGDERSPVWTNDSARLVYTSEPGMRFTMLVKDVEASTASTALFASANPRYASSVSPDGSVVAFEENNPGTGWDIWTGPIDGAGEARPFLNTRYSESFPTFSPDGKWVAYQSDESGDPQIYVVKYPGPGGKRQVSQAGGIQPAWGAQGKELFYLSGNRLMAVETSFTPTLRLGPTKTIFSVDGLRLSAGTPWRTYSVSPDGRRFAFVKIVPSAPATSLQVIVNWFDDMKARVQAGK